MMPSFAAPALLILILEPPAYVLVQIEYANPGPNQQYGHGRLLGDLRSQPTLQKALASIPPGHANTLRGKENPLLWMSRNLEAVFIRWDNRFGVLRIGLRGLPPDELCLVVNAVAEAFCRDVIGNERDRYESSAKGMKKHIEKLRKEAQKYGDLYRNYQGNDPKEKAEFLARVDGLNAEVINMEKVLGHYERIANKGLPKAEVIRPAKP